MRICAVLLTAPLLLSSPAVGAGSSFLDAAKRLNGEWVGDAYALRIDSYRAQANLDLDRPFHWQRFLVKEVAGEKVTFTVGAELFEATLDADWLTLTSTSFRGERVLRRHEESKAPSGMIDELGLRR